METIKYEDLKCEFCDGAGEFSRDNSDGVVEGDCSYCNGTGIDEDQLRKAFVERIGANEPCVSYGCSIDAHRDDMICPNFAFGEFNGWLDTKFLVKT